VTVISGNYVAITWTQPFDGASPITSYSIRIRQGDNTVFTAEPNSCDGTNPAVIGQLSCAVPISTLKAAPYSLDWGVPVYAIVSAINIVGPSVFSAQTLDADAAIILTNPDAPINLVNVPSITSATKVGLTWTIGDKDGGSPVIDYTVSKALGTGSYEVYQQGILTTSFTVEGLQAGSTYNFVVQSRNKFGLSIFSQSTPISVLAA
jgi:Fibronectin type III domain